MDGETWIASDGRAYLVDLRDYSEPENLDLNEAQVSRTALHLGRVPAYRRSEYRLQC